MIVLYIKILVGAEELIDFIKYTQSITTSDDMKDAIGVTEDELEDICKHAAEDKVKAEKLKKILTVNLIDMA